MHFDIMRKPWLTCTMTNGTTKELSLYDTVLSAHKIRKIYIPSRFYFCEYILYSFIVDFVQDIYKPHGDIEDVIEDYLEEGKFEKDKLDKYIENFEKSGFSFDLFDKDFPFMQTPTSQMAKVTQKQEKYLSALGVEYGSGNEVLFFNHNINFSVDNHEDQGELTPCEAMLQLLYVTAYRHGYAFNFPSIACGDSSGLHPIFAMNFGKNLYETVVLSWNTQKKECIPIWRRKVSNLQEIVESNSFDALDATYFQSFFIQLIDFRKCYFIEPEITTGKENKKKKEEYSELIALSYRRWIENHPRIIIETVHYKDKKTKKQVENRRAITYKEKSDSYSWLETMKLDLCASSDSCKIIKNNRQIAENLGYEVTTNFYVLSHKNKASKNIIELEHFFTWETNKYFPDSHAQLHLKRCLKAITACAKSTAFAITYMDLLAESGKDGEDIPKVDGFSTIAIQITDDCVSKCMWLLENSLYDDLFLEGKEVPLKIQNAIRNIFFNALNKYHVAKQDLIAKEEAINSFVYKTANVFEEKE